VHGKSFFCEIFQNIEGKRRAKGAKCVKTMSINELSNYLDGCMEIISSSSS